MRTTIPITLLSLVIAGAAAQPRQPSLRVYAVDVARSQLYAVTHRAGLLSFLGHEHAIVPADWSAELCLDEPVPRGARASVIVRTATLAIDSDSARALAGLGGGPDAEDVREIQRTMLGPGNLDAERYPDIRLEVEATEVRDDGDPNVRGRLQLRGATRDVELPVAIEPLDAGALAFAGTLRIRLRDFGIEPESIGGVVKVANDVDLRFRLVATPTDAPCRTSGGGESDRERPVPLLRSIHRLLR